MRSLPPSKPLTGPAPPRRSVCAPGALLVSCNTLVTCTVTLSAAYDHLVTLSYRTVNGTATTGDNDYVAKSGTLTFAPGQTMKTITIEVKGDSKREANETFTWTCSG